MVVHWKEGPQSASCDIQEVCFVPGIDLSFHGMHSLMLGFINLGGHGQTVQGGLTENRKET